MTEFSLSRYEPGDKDLFLLTSEAQGELEITIDFDDVDKYITACNLRKMLAILNDHWLDPEYAHLTAEPMPEYDLNDDDAFDDLWDARMETAMEILRGLVRKEEVTP